MKKNVGNLDKAIRVILGVLFAILYFTNVISGTAGIILLVIGIVLIFTAIFSFCPIYWTLGLKSRTKE
jgi:hypothetical protein